jgi:hypothetical protein
MLAGCCVLVWRRDSDVEEAHALVALVSKLRELGAKPAARLSKEVTHIIFRRKLNATVPERLAEDSELKDLHDRVFKVRTRAI